MNENKHMIAISLLAVSWTLLLWINFYAELSVAMHLIAIPVLMAITLGYAGYWLEYDDLR